MKLFALVLLVFMVLLISNILACEEDQVDINTADKQELMKIVYIGEARAQLIIDSRPYESVDDLIKIKGIGEVYLSKIKAQGLACVNGEERDEEKSIEEEIKKNETVEKNISSIDENIIKEEIKRVEIKKIEPQVIKLIAKDIKTEEFNEKNNNKNYATYGFIVFCLLLVILFITRKRQLNKTEF